MRQVLRLSVICLFAVVFFACGPGNPYKEDIQSIDEICKFLDKFTKELEISGNDDAIATATNNAVGQYQALLPKINQLRVKYQKFGKADSEALAPEGIRPHLKRIRISYELLRMVLKGKWLKHRKNEDAMIILRMIQKTLLSE